GGRDEAPGASHHARRPGRRGGAGDSRGGGGRGGGGRGAADPARSGPRAGLPGVGGEGRHRPGTGVWQRWGGKLQVCAAKKVKIWLMVAFRVDLEGKKGYI